MLDTRLKINAIEVRRGEESNWMIVVRGEVFFLFGRTLLWLMMSFVVDHQTEPIGESYL